MTKHINGISAEMHKTLSGHFLQERKNAEDLTRRTLKLEPEDEIPAYKHQAYPKHKYHASQPSVIVDSPESEKDLGDGWSDAPVQPAPLSAEGEVKQLTARLAELKGKK